MSALAIHPASVTLDTSRPFLRAEAYAAGLTDHDLRSTKFVRVFHGVYVARTTTRTVSVRTAAALRIAPASAMASHHTAAVLWGGAVPRHSVVHLTVPHTMNCQADGLTCHRYRSISRPVLRNGLRLTSPERTFADLGRSLDLVELVTLGDRFVRRGVTTPAQLVAAADAWRGPRARLLRRASRLVRPGVDAPPESRLRMLMVLAGLPEPDVNHIIADPVTGEWQRRFELAYPELRLAVEYQGRWHRQSEDVWAADIAGRHPRPCCWRSGRRSSRVRRS